ncbi:hypothetical protein AB1Y20_003948 [Prymnesium parvum]|mmetsp:Transcript_971/g.2522  ORF Transcript_971/g.2522 Transcript_971/m.2522 type:complete len:230 (+) Transcript_971:92-781(+)
MNSTMTMEGANEFEGAFKKKMPPRAPRRRRAADDDDGETEDPNPGGAKKSGWGDSANEDGDGVAPAPIAPRRRRGGDDDGDETARKHDSMSSPNKHEIADMEEGDNDTIANLIPDLEDEQLDMARQVAEAPHLTKSRVQSIQELDDEIDMALPSASEIGIDLSVLQSYLMPQEQVVEEDVPWDFSSELQSLASEMQQERDALKAGDEPAIHVAPLPKAKERVRKPLAEA